VPSVRDRLREMDLAPERLEIYERLLDAYIGQGLLAEPDGGEQSLPIPGPPPVPWTRSLWVK